MAINIIAEAGVNHNGDMKLAEKMIAVAAKAGADIVKFQTFRANELAAVDAPKAGYQQKLTGEKENQHAMLLRLQLPYKEHQRLVDCCNHHGVEFLSTAFEMKSLSFLKKNIDLLRFKIPSGEITNGPFLHAHAILGQEIILSTGMANLIEVKNALAVLAQGYLYSQETISSFQQCAETFSRPEAQAILQEKVTLMHCTSQYPTPADATNLKAITTLQEEFGLNVGYSDHTLGSLAATGAVCLGATVIEKHFTLDKKMAGPDHQASADPDELSQYIADIRQMEKMLGDGVKTMQPCEAEVRSVIRKSIVAAKDISCGEAFTKNNITIVRPASGVDPMSYWDLTRQNASRSYKKGDLILESF